MAAVLSTATRSMAGVVVPPAGPLPGSPAVQELRKQALALFEREGLPHRRVEDWKYTDLRTSMRELAPIVPALDPATRTRAAASVAAHRIEGSVTIALVNGAFVADLSDVKALEAGLSVRSLAEALRDDPEIGSRLSIAADTSDPMAALNVALVADGAVIDVANEAVPARPIHLLHLALTDRPVAIYSRSLIRIGARARATLIESFVGAEAAAGYQVNDAVSITVGDHADLQHVRFMRDHESAFNISTAFFQLGENTALNTFNLTAGGAVSRYQGVVRFSGVHAHAATNGVNLLRDRQHGDTTLFVDHSVPNGTSREVFRAVLDDRAHSVFQGRIVVQPKAQKTDAKMMTRALLLSDQAEADNKPELEIFADDVTCGHGATSGALDEALLFYLRARGLTEKQAQALLIQAFVGEAIESIADDRLRQTAIDIAEHWLAART